MKIKQATRSAAVARSWQDASVRSRRTESNRRTWADPLVRERRIRGIKNACARPDVKNKRSIAQYKVWLDPSRRQKARVWWASPVTKEVRQRRNEKISNAKKGQPKSLEHRQRQSVTLRRLYATGQLVASMKGKTLSVVMRAKLSEAHRHLWATMTEAMRQKRLTITARAMSKHPNRLESNVLATLIDAFPDAGWRFNPGVVVAGKIPDFVRSDGGTIAVDVYGDYWHRDDTQRSIRGRQRAFRTEGYRLIVVWEREFNQDRLIAVTRVRRALAKTRHGLHV